MEGTLKGAMVSDYQGKIWCERDVSVVNSASTALPTALSLSKKDWIEQPTIDRRYYNETSFIEMGGICFDPATMGSAAVLCGAPGLAPSYHGKVERIQGLALLTQAELNTIAGNLFAFKNSDYPSVEYKLRANYWNLDIAPQEKFAITMLANESPYNIAWTNKAFAIRGIDRSYIEGTIIPRVSLAEITQGYAATTIVIPAIPPTENPDGGTYENTPVPTPTSPPTPTSVFAIYHNDVFVGNALGLNFLDSNYTSTGTV
jgi:hypothetical protein